jgi:hypothetical protein
MYVYTHTCTYIHTCTCMCVQYSLYPFIDCWAPPLILQLSYCEYSCNKHGYSGISLVYWFTLHCIYALKWYDSIIRCLFLVFWGIFILVSTVVALVYILINNVWVFLFPQQSHQHLLFVFLMIANLTGVRWNHCILLISISFRAKDVEHFFLYFFSHLNFFSWELSVQFICTFINWIIYSFSVQFFLTLCIFWILIPHLLNK